MALIKSVSLAAALSLVLLASPVSAQDKPHLGFSTQFAVSGGANPTVGKLTVSGVTKGAPADAAGLKSGDEIIEINGKPAVGTPAADVAASIKGTKTGTHLRFKVKRLDGSLASIDIIAG